jgi:hypothetical protein
MCRPLFCFDPGVRVDRDVPNESVRPDWAFSKQTIFGQESDDAA